MKKVQTIIMAMILLIAVLCSESVVFGKEVTPKNLKGKTRQEVVELVGPLFTEEQKKTGILASVSMAQFLLETGFGQSELFCNANNGFGMNCVISNNKWSGSTWDGQSVYRKNDLHLVRGKLVPVPCDFRKYSSFTDSIADHSAYLLGAAKKDGTKRYKGIDKETDFRKACRIITDGGYSFGTYGDNLISIIERYELTAFDIKASVQKESKKKDTNPVKKSDIYIVMSDDLNVRSTASPKSQILGKYLKGEQVQVITVNANNWGQVKTKNGKIGWMNLGYCRKKDIITFQVTSDTLNIRSKANPQSSIYGFYNCGDTIEVIQMKGKWGQVNYKGKTGWVNTGYCIRK